MGRGVLHPRRHPVPLRCCAGALHPPAVAALHDDPRILVVEDEPAVLALVSRVLQQNGYRVLVADNGAVATAVYREHHDEIDLVFSDVVMPEMGGPEMVDRLEREGFAPRALFTSGYMDSALTRLDAWRGDVALLHKPFSPRELLQRVRDVLDRRPAGG